MVCEIYVDKTMHSVFCGTEGSGKVAEVSIDFSAGYRHSVNIVGLHPLNKLLQVG